MLRAALGLVLVNLCSNPVFGQRPHSESSNPLADIRREYRAIQSAKTSHSKALHAYRLNDAADRYAQHLNEQNIQRTTNRKIQSKTQEPKRYGADIHWCTYNGDWTAGSQGYESSLSLWPDGPNAEEAWWRGRLHNKRIFCFDAAGTQEETADFVHQYEDFLKHFPQGNHAAEARARLRQFRADLTAYKE